MAKKNHKATLIPCYFFFLFSAMAANKKIKPGKRIVWGREVIAMCLGLGWFVPLGRW